MIRIASALSLAGLLASAACAPRSEAPPAEAAAEPAAAGVPQAWFGDYADPEYPDNGWWRKLTVAPGATAAEATVTFTSTSTRSGSDEPDCSFAGTGTWVDDRLEAPIEWKAADDVAVTMIISAAGDTAVVSATGGSDPALGLGWYCRGGATLAGSYPRVR